jgi:acetylornithine aminotransferase
MSQEWREGAEEVITSTYTRFPVVLQSGKGTIVRDTSGKEYIDFVGGIAVCGLGHSHPRISEALYRQSRTLVHTSNLYYTIPQVELALWLTSNSFADRVFFGNSGAEANEAAIKLVRRYFYEKGETNRYRIIAMKQSFHGRTMATLSATGQEKIQKGYAPLLDGFDFVEFNDIDAVKQNIDSRTCAVMVEPIQGEGGVREADRWYMRELRQLCSAAGVWLVFDEIQTGMGRTGRLFAYEHYGIEPDIMTLAKALGNGLPIGAMLAREEVAGAFNPGSHASTFGGTPLICAGALEVTRIFHDEDILKLCRETGEYFKKRLLWLKDRHAKVEDVRGKGLLLGMKLKEKGDGIVNSCLEEGFLINCIQEDILRFVPPLNIETREVDALVDCLDRLLSQS